MSEGDRGLLDGPFRSRRNFRRGMDRRWHPGFTLLELLIVFAILAVLAAVGWPVMQRPLAKGRLRQAAQDIIQEIADTRMRAIETGEVYQFRYSLDDGCYESAPVQAVYLEQQELGGQREKTAADWDPERSYISADQEAGADDDDFGRSTGRSAVLGDDDAAQDRLLERVREKLPEGITFLDPATVEENEDLLSQPPDGSLPSRSISLADDLMNADATNAAPLIWAPPVLFYPDGRATNAQLILRGEGYQVNLQVRGFTGGVKTGPVQRLPETEEELMEDPGGAAAEQWSEQTAE